MLIITIYIVKEVIESRGQEPYIAFKLQSLLENQQLKVHHYENKDVFLGKLPTMHSLIVFSYILN